MTKARDERGPGDFGEAPSLSAPSHPRKQRDVGELLKSAYQETVREDIPPEFLDLLGKLD